MDQGGLRALLSAWTDRGQPVATSDPFVGALHRIDGESFSAAHPLRDWMAAHFRETFELLRDLPHLYLAPHVDTPVRHVAFHNPELIAGRKRRREAQRPRWLFVLSPEDLAHQVAIHGLAGFHATLADRLADAVRAGRQPALIAPRATIDAVRRDPRLGTLAAWPGCDYATFMGLIRESEYALYWNAFSASILARVLDGAPFFAFDRGHVSRAVPAFAEFGRRHFYLDRELELLDPGAALDPAALAAKARELESWLLAPLAARVRALPTPGEVTRRLLAGRVG
jgi:hypothetical protein